MEREVIVVGAGPSGSTAAMALAQRGHDVLMIDRKGFPRDKTCGDAIPGGAIEILYTLGMKERIEAADFYPAYKMLLSSPNQHEIIADLIKGPQGGDSCIVPRYKFDTVLYDHAIDSGADFCQAQVKEPIMEDGKVKGVRIKSNGGVQDIRAKMVIGADGVTSVIARSLLEYKHEDKHRAIALRAYIEDFEVTPHMVEFYLYKGILPGYAWIFPFGERKANIGLGMRLDKFRKEDKSLKEMLDVFMEIPAIKKRTTGQTKIENIATWQLNFGSKWDIPRTFDGAILIGDAAGLINPLTGGGIHNGVVSAKIAADVIHEAFCENDFSRQRFLKYETACTEKMEKSMKQSYLIQRTLLNMPFVVDLLIRFGSANGDLAQTFVNKL
jgi:geranylgeranyl reductase family protein